MTVARYITTARRRHTAKCRWSSGTIARHHAAGINVLCAVLPRMRTTRKRVPDDRSRRKRSSGKADCVAQAYYSDVVMSLYRIRKLKSMTILSYCGLRFSGLADRGRAAIRRDALRRGTAGMCLRDQIADRVSYAISLLVHGGAAKVLQFAP